MPLTVDGVISGIAAPSPSRAMYVDLSKAAPANRIFLGIAEIGGAEGERLGVNAAQIAAIFHILNQPGLCEIRDTKHRGRRRKLRRGLGLPTTWKKMHIKPGLVGVRPEDHDAHHGRPLHFVRGYLRRWDGPETDANCFYADGPRGRRLYRRIDGYWRGDRALGLKLHHYTPDPKRGSPCHPARATQNCAPTEEPSR